MSATGSNANAPDAPRSIIAAELEVWRESIVEDADCQDHALYRPHWVMEFLCTLALIDAGYPEPDPFASSRIETTVSRFNDYDDVRCCSSVDAKPDLFARGGGLLGDWTSGKNAVGDLTPEEWAERGIAVVWWRPHDLGRLCLYIEEEGAVDLRVGEEATGRWGEKYLPVTGPRVPNNRCDSRRVRPIYPWVHAAPRQLDLLANSG